MNSKRASNSIHKRCSPSLGVEIVQSPLHPDKSLNGVSWYDLENAVTSDIELKNVLYSDISVLSTLFLLDRSIVLNLVIPLVHLNEIVTSVSDRIRA